jgi:prepilin-type N-terminal cleavage/methylation domain-containing protein
MTTSVNRKSESGFTLIELSIVLVIIGLIIGGVLVGQDMIKSAEIRATVQQIEKYNSVVNTFRGKYNALPGDLDDTTENRFGFLTRTNAAGHGDGNRLLEGCAAAATVAGCETVLFWRDLSFANLIEGSFTTATDALAASLTGANMPSYFPSAKIGRGNYVTVYASGGFNYYQIAGITSTDAAGVYTLANNMTPLEAQNMDLKVDDGLPSTGIATAMAGTGTVNVAATPAAAAAGVCVSTTLTPNNYNTETSTFASTPACQLRIRFN